jgi:eight-cysteine-cluster-containing protein
VILAVLLACAGPKTVSESPAPPAPTVTEGAPADPGVPTSLDGMADGGTPGGAPGGGAARSPREAYEGCRDRVEGEDTPGECATDADCAPAGCGHEMCIPAARAGDVMSTCEVLPCFAVLDTCGCHAGVCTWTVKAELPPLAHPPLPAR